ncbi:unnamed protein product [Lymnaea stagnalis]|uniref:PH domain-containing protein n=1 Tax=Lymnaea stagnalis TaxID=6523 RepID=A0AAV2ICN5_LYMST
MMADTATTNLSFRESGLYIGPEIEGFLEKKGTGVIVRKTNRTWCSLQGSTLYFKKSQGLMDTLDIGEAHQVKKSGSDPTVFEITIKKKSHIFICPTSEECTKWVKALHHAMARKESGNRGSNFFLPSDDSEKVNGEYESVYATIAGEQSDVMDLTNENRVYNVSSEYSDPVDSKEKTLEGQDPLYSDIIDVNIQVNTRAKTEIDEDIASSETSNPAETEMETYSDGYSTVQKCKQTPDSSTTQTLTVSGNRKSGTITKETPGGVYNEASSTNDSGRVADEDHSVNVTQLRSSLVHNKTTPETAAEKDKEETVDPFSMLVAALALDETPVLAYNHPLTQADVEPLKQLKECLSKHPGLCEASYMASAADDNPILSLKAYLKTLNIQS